ncbi:hypothetical protein Bbelb_193000 [Branchiostoma belcheri]|nr:hypothetical protein Bbelb_193000 [Branchiostoma belcheri]
MGRACKRVVACLLLTLLLLYLLPWFWSGSLQPASGFFNYEVDEMLGQERQGKIYESKSNPDVVTEAGLGVGQPGQRRLCPPGSFRLSTMETCMPWLGCNEITNEVTTLERIGSGGIKKRCDNLSCTLGRKRHMFVPIQKDNANPDRVQIGCKSKSSAL